MVRETQSANEARTATLRALRDAFRRDRSDIEIDDGGYIASFHDNLLPGVLVDDFVADLQSGDGNELETKFRAAHSSSALAVNTFAPFRTRRSDLDLLEAGPFQSLQFERKCPTGLRGGRAPNLDVLLCGHPGVIGIESKLTEYLSRHRAKFRPSYLQQIRDERCEQGYFREMLRLLEQPDHYAWLDAAQLIKHAFGLARTFRSQPVRLLYLYWEPVNPEAYPVFGEHRREIEEFAERVAGSTPEFHSMSYPDLWAALGKTAPEWLSVHLGNLSSRYLVTI